MRRLILVVMLFAFAHAVGAHTTDPKQGDTVTLGYSGPPLKISVTHVPGELCTVTADAVEIVIGKPLLTFTRTVPQPVLDALLSITAIRHPENHSETTAARLAWRATGFRADGVPDPQCNASGEVLFNVTVTEPTVANKPTPTITPTDPISLADGELFFEESPDLETGGGPLWLNFTRYYASRLKGSAGATPLGENWSHNYLFRLNPPAAGLVTIVDNRGRVLTFQQAGTAFTLSSPTFAAYQLVKTTTGFRLGDSIEERFYDFDEAGALLAVRDRAGNALSLTYTAGNLSGISDGLGRALSLAYDSSNRIVSVSDGVRTVTYGYSGGFLRSFTDVRGNQTQYTYDTSTGLTGLLSRKTRPLGNAVSVQTWNARGDVLTQTDGTQHTFRFAYGLDHRTVQTDPAGNTRTYLFDENGSLLSVTDENGKTSSCTNDSSGRASSCTDSLGFQTQVTFDPLSGKLSTYREPDGSTTAYTYSTQTQSGIAFRVLTKITYPDGSTEELSYDASGNVTSLTDRAGKLTTMTRNSRGQVLTVTNPAGGITTFTYGNDGTVSSVRDAAGNTTAIGYDTLRRANLVTYPDGNTRRYTLDSAGHLLTDTDERGKTARFSYDANGNLTSITDPLGNVTTIGYDAMDRAVSVTDSRGEKASRTFDSLGRVASSTDRNANVFTYGYDPTSRQISVSDPSGAVWRRTYDSEGFPLSQADPLNHTWSFNRDALARVVKSTSPAAGVLSISYDAGGRVSRFTDPAGVTTVFRSDPRGVLTDVTQGGLVSNTVTLNDLGLVTRLIDGNGKSWQHDYDSRGRTVSTKDPLGAVTTLAYDRANRVSQMVFPGGLGSLQLTYDGVGNVERRGFSDGTILDFTFDDASRMTSASGLTLTYDAMGAISSSNGITIVRDAGGRITSMSLAPGKTITYAYDRRDLLIEVRDWAGGKTTLGYDAASRLISLTRPNGMVSTFTYNADGATTGIEERRNGVVSSISIQRGARGQIVSETRNVPLQPSSALESSSFTYDDASQVSGYTYDKLGRLTIDAGRRYTWDLASRLSSYTDSQGLTSFTYDALGQRLTRTQGGSTRTFVWNYALGRRSVSIVRQGGSDLRYYVHTPGGALLYSIDAAGNKRRFFHFDQLGNTIYLTDDNATVTDAYAYGPYGEPLGRTGTTDNPFTFAGENGTMQESVGLYYMRARYYDASSARFLSRDPSRRSPAPNESNAYTFARSNPLLFADPDGLSAQINYAGPHTDLTVDVWQGDKIIGTLNASFGEGGYRETGGSGGVLAGGRGNFKVNFRFGQCLSENGPNDTKFVHGTREQDERTARAMLSAIDFGSVNQPLYQVGTPAAEFLLARLKEAGRAETGEQKSVLQFSTRGSGDWVTYGAVLPGRTCNTFTGEMLNVYLGTQLPTGVLAESVTAILTSFQNQPKPVVVKIPGTENSGNIMLWLRHP